MKKKSILFIISLIFVFGCYSQRQVKIDSLNKKIALSNNNTDKLKEYNSILAWVDYGSSADKILSKYYDLANKENSEKDIAFCLQYKSQFKANTGEYTEALRLINKSISTFKRFNYNTQLLKTYYVKGNIFDVSNRLDSAKYYYNAAYNLAKSSNDYFLTNYQLGIYYLKVRDFKSSIKHLNKAQDIAIKLADSIKIAKVQYRLGILLQNQKQQRKAIKKLLQSLKVLKNNDSKTIEIANVIFAIGNHFLDSKKYSKALPHYKEALYLYKKNNSKLMIGYSFSSLGSCYGNLKRIKQAEKYLDSAIIFLKEVGDFKAILNVYNRKSIIAFNQKNYSKAISSTKNALTLAKQLKLNKRTYSMYHNLGFLYDTIGKDKLAYKNMLLAFRYKDTVLKNDYFNSLAEIEVKYETQQKENKILVLQNENFIKEVRLTKSKYTIYGILSTLLLVLGFTYFFWHKKKQKQKLALLENTVKTSEKEKQRIGKELHDSIAGTIIKLVYETEGTQSELSDKLLKTYNEVRNLSHQLDNTAFHNELFVDRVLELVPDKFKDKIFSISINPNHLKLEEPYGTHIYRIIQELISNNLKHAKANNTSMRLFYDNNELGFTYKDDGIGIKKLKKGNGFKNIEDRIELMQGKLVLNSSIEKGLELSFVIPYKA